MVECKLNIFNKSQGGCVCDSFQNPYTMLTTHESKPLLIAHNHEDIGTIKKGKNSL